MHDPIGPEPIRGTPAVENECFFHTEQLNVTADFSVFSSCFPVAFVSGSVHSSAVPVLLV